MNASTLKSKFRAIGIEIVIPVNILCGCRLDLFK